MTDVSVPTAAAQIEIHQVAEVQQKLRELGYVNTGPVDGDLTPKGKTEAAILDVRNALDLPLTPTIDAELIKALETAPSKDIPIEQATATAAEIAPKVEAVKQTRWAKFWAKVTAFPSLVIAAVLAVVERFDEAVKYITPIKDFAGDVPAWVWIGGVGAIASLIAFNMGKVENAQVDAYRGGTMGDDNQTQES